MVGWIRRLVFVFGRILLTGLLWWILLLYAYLFVLAWDLGSLEPTGFEAHGRGEGERRTGFLDDCCVHCGMKVLAYSS